MKNQPFRVKEALSFGWETFKNNVKFFIILMLVLALFYILPDILADIVMARVLILGIALHIIHTLFLWLLNLGRINISLKFYDNLSTRIDDLFSCLPVFGNYVIATICYSLITMIGFILFIIPGIILSIKYCFFAYFIVDRKMGPIESLEASSRITKGAKWDIFVFGCLLTLINIAGLLALGIGLFITVPVTMLSMAYVYRKLLERVEIIPDTEEETAAPTTPHY